MAVPSAPRNKQPKLFLRRRAVLPIVILAISISAAFYFVATKQAVAPHPVQEFKWPVRVVTGQPKDVRPQIVAYGEVVARHTLEVRPLVAGRIESIGKNFRNGGFVAAGEELLRVEPFDYRAAAAEASAQTAEAEARLIELQAQLQLAKSKLETDREQLTLRQSDYDRKLRLVENGTTPRSTLDTAAIALNLERNKVLSTEGDVEVLHAKISQQEAQIDQSKTRVQRAERDVSDTILIAPFSGYLTDVNIATGKQVSPSDLVAKLYDSDALEVRFHLSNKHYARLIASSSVGQQPIEVSWQVGEVKRSYKATIARTEGRIDPASGGIALYAAIEKSESDALLRPGAFVKLIIPDRTYRDVFELPRTAVYETGTVYIVGPDGRLEQRQTTIVLRDGDSVLVEGDLDGQKIVTTDFREIGPGILVEIVEDQG